MNIEGMRYFVELAEAGSFYGAAKRLFISQQGLNKAITSMEAELGVKLVERSRQGITLTGEGHRFLASARAMTDEYGKLLSSYYGAEAVGRAEESTLMHVTYYSSQIASASMQYVSLLRNATYLEEPFEKIERLAATSDGSDLAFVDLHANTANRVLTDPDLAFEPTLSTQVGIVCSQDHPLATADSVRRKDVCNLPIASNSQREMAHLIDWIFRDQQLTDIRMRVTSPRMLLQSVQTAPEGIALFDSFGFYLSTLDTGMPTDNLTFVPLSTPESRCYVGFLHRKHVRPSPRVQSAIDTLDRYLAEYHGSYLAEHPLSTTA